jgi:hypothetical protein
VKGTVREVFCRSGPRTWNAEIAGPFARRFDRRRNLRVRFIPASLYRGRLLNGRLLRRLIGMGRIFSASVTAAGQVNVWINTGDHCLDGKAHVHAGDGGDRWEARFVFSFCTNVVSFWDCITPKTKPRQTVINAITHEIARYLRQCRAEWWRFYGQTIGCCLTNQTFPDNAGHPRQIQTAVYDPVNFVTHITFSNGFTRQVIL